MPPIDDTKQYKAVCKAEFERLHAKLDAMNEKLFIGNGQPSLCARVYGHSLKIKLLLWVSGVVCVAVIGILADRIIK